jgi:hypothetical protein
MNQHKLRGILNEVAKEYPGDMVQGQVLDIPRIAFHISLVLEIANTKSPSELSICDVGGVLDCFQ